MADHGAHISSIEALKVFRDKYILFASRVSEELKRIGDILRYRTEEAEKAYLRQQSYVEMLREIYNNAKNEEERWEYRRKLDQAEELLGLMEQTIQRIRDRELIYQQAVRSVRYIIENHVPKGTSFLEGCISDLEKYLSLSPPADVETRTSSTSPTVPSERNTAAREPAPQECPRCGGSGWVERFRLRWGPERYEWSRNPDKLTPCPYCGGKGILENKSQTVQGDD